MCESIALDYISAKKIDSVDTEMQLGPAESIG